MDNKDLKELLKKSSNPQMLSRRDALKLMGISPIAAGVLASTSSSTISSAAASDAKGKIVIVGGGAGGIMALARLNSALRNPDITIIAPNELHIYQPGQIFQAAGLYLHDDLVKPNSDFIPDSVNWIKDEVEEFDPDNNTLTTRSGEKVPYDYLVVAAGIDYHYDWIRGLKEEDIGTKGISSVYLSNFEKGTTDGGSVVAHRRRYSTSLPITLKKMVSLLSTPSQLQEESSLVSNPSQTLLGRFKSVMTPSPISSTTT